MDKFANNQAGLGSPASNAAAVVPNDGADLAVSTRGVYCSVSGDVKVDMVDGGTVTFGSLAAGMIHPLRVKRVYSTGTSALGIVGVY